MPLTPDYNTLFTERIAIANTYPNLRAGSSRRPVIGVIPRIREAEPSAPELPPEEQIRLSPRVRRTFPELSQEEEEHETGQPEFTIPHFDQIRDTLNDGEIPPELEFFNGGKNPILDHIINNIGIDQDSKEFLNFLKDDIYEGLMQRNKVSIHTLNYDNVDTGESIYSFFIA